MSEVWFDFDLMPCHEICRLGAPVTMPHDRVALIMNSDGLVITISAPKALIYEFGGSRPLGGIFVLVCGRRAEIIDQ